MSTGAVPVAWTYKTGNYAWTVAVSHDGRHVVAGSDDMRTYFFDADSTAGKPLWIHNAGGYVRHVAVSSNASYAAAGDTAGQIFLFRSPVLGDQASVFPAGSPIDALSMSDDGAYLVGGDRQGVIYVFRTSQLYFPFWQYGVPGGVLALSLSRSGVLVASSTRGGLYFFGEVTSPSGCIWTFQDQTSFPYVALSPNADYVVAGGGDGYVYLLDSSGGLMDRQELGGAVSTLELSATADMVVAGSTNGMVLLYSVNGGLVVTSSLEGRRPVTSVTISDNGERVGVANIDGEISMFDQSLRVPLWAFGTGAIVHSLSVSDNGLVMAGADDTGSVYLFNDERPENANEMALGFALVFTIGAVLLVAHLARRKKMATLRSQNATGKIYDGRRSS